MITGAIAKEQIQDRVRAAERDRRAASTRRVRSRTSISGFGAILSAAVRRPAKRITDYRVRTV